MNDRFGDTVKGEIVELEIWPRIVLTWWANIKFGVMVFAFDFVFSRLTRGVSCWRYWVVLIILRLVEHSLKCAPEVGVNWFVQLSTGGQKEIIEVVEICINLWRLLGL